MGDESILALEDNDIAASDLPFAVIHQQLVALTQEGQHAAAAHWDPMCLPGLPPQNHSRFERLGGDGVTTGEARIRAFGQLLTIGYRWHVYFVVRNHMDPGCWVSEENICFHQLA